MLATGTRLGPFEVIAPLGAGGMGEVYRARDTRLERSVAIKVLQADFAFDPALRKRFEREARAISSLNHSHICALYDIGVQGGTDYIVMELLEGETLRDRLKKGPLGLEQALRLGVEISDALDTAHKSGVVHRDLKPANVMLTKSGAKLLDFGLAKVGGVIVGGDAKHSRLAALTAEGSLLGTLQYMAPEQLHGKDADARSDIFAFGALLYEMLTAECAFQGESSASVIAAILNQDPRAISEMQPLTPPSLERAVKRCLAKDPDDRWQSARDLMHELQWIAANPVQDVASAQATNSRERAAWLAAAALGVLAIAAGVAWWTERGESALPNVRLELARPVDHAYEYFHQAVVSPDGKRIVFVGYDESGRKLWLRGLDEVAAHPLEGTDGGKQPFWSPNSRFLGFFAGGKLKRIDASGGPAQILCDAVEPWGGAWSSDGTILFCGGNLEPLSRVPDSGGKPVPATRLAPKEEAQRWPSFLPDGRHFICAGDASLTEEHHLDVGSLDSLDCTQLVQMVSNAAYVAPGYVLYVRGGNLLAQRFDAEHLRLAGDPITIAEHIVECDDNHRFEFSASDTGVLTCRSADNRGKLCWIDGAQHRTNITTAPERFGNARLSRDGKQVAFTEDDVDGRATDIVLLDLERGARTRVTSDPASDFGPVWSPDGERIVFSSYRTQTGDLYVARLQGAIEERLLLSTPLQKHAECWSADGKWIFFEVDTAHGTHDMWVLPVDDPTQAHVVTANRAFGGTAQLSPDSRWLAFTSDESGQGEVYVQGFPTGKRVRVSSAGGGVPRWSHDGAMLYFVAGRSDLMVADVKSGAELDVGVPRALFSLGSSQLCDVAPDGRFLVLAPVEEPTDASLTVILGWTGALERR
jgi:Tol biopolymer transport system component